MAAPTSLIIRLNNSDNVVVARFDIAAGTDISEERIVCSDSISFGHKIAVRTVKTGEAVIKYGQIIGFAASDIKPGAGQQGWWFKHDS